ncbi:MFS transporter [Reyranella sp.]|uniref:MFS transporter n=1 Tax=Reyranella sp. TaxID=1929291 RepID=UPI00122AFCF9|nr:MFS transporter [Reyranella sp.]TAJ83541.1 MAG: MFS transporter [Reyranella sp.]
MDRSRLPTILVLGTAQTLAWGSTYYLPAVLADEIARDIGISTNLFFGAFSASLIISALIGPKVGRAIDRAGGNGVLSAANILFAAALVLMSLAHSFALFAVAWILMGIGMGLGLYDAAFAALGRLYGMAARGPITGITLLAGFASTIGWPLTAWGAAEIGWRDTCLAWAVAHIVIGLPLNYFLLPRPKDLAVTAKAADQPVPIDRPMILLAFAFSAAWIVTAGMAAHFPRIMEAAGATSTQAIAAGALIGPAQVAARLLEAGFLSRFHPLVSARLAMTTHPVGAAVILTAGGGVAASAFAVLHGMGNGIITIARGTVPLALYGPKNYGYRLGLLGAPSRFLSAGAPLGFSLLIDHLGANVLLVSSGLCLASFAALCLLRRTAPAPVPSHAD